MRRANYASPNTSSSLRTTSCCIVGKPTQSFKQVLHQLFSRMPTSYIQSRESAQLLSETFFASVPRSAFPETSSKKKSMARAHEEAKEGTTDAHPEKESKVGPT